MSGYTYFVQLFDSLLYITLGGGRYTVWHIYLIATAVMQDQPLSWVRLLRLAQLYVFKSIKTNF